MAYYVKGFGKLPYKFKVVKTSDPEISDGKTKLEAIVQAINYTSKTLQSWKTESSAQAKQIVKQQRLALKELGKLLQKES